MKKLFAALVIMALFTTPVWADECSTCTKEKPCSVSFPMGNMIIVHDTWCRAGQWYVGSVARVILPGGTEEMKIDNPFQVK